MRPQTIVHAIGAGAVLGTLALPIAAATAQAPPATPAGATTALTTGAAATPAGGDVDRRRLNVVSGGRASVTGRVAPARAGARVALQRRADGEWHTVHRARSAADGAFVLRFRPQRSGSASVRVRAGEWQQGVGRLNVFRRAQASWYGPGLYGGKLGCGGRLTSSTVGVAHKTLPCGSEVTLRHRGRSVRVPVVDRGPYVGGREFDLTAATKRRLGFSGVGSLLVAS